MVSSMVGAVMAEWLRRWTRNPMGFSRAGSNPARSDLFFKIFKKGFGSQQTVVATPLIALVLKSIALSEQTTNKNVFPDGESNPGRRGESAKS